MIFNGGGTFLFAIEATTYYMCRPVDASGNPIGGWVPLESLTWSYYAAAAWGWRVGSLPTVTSVGSVLTPAGWSAMQSNQVYSFDATTAFPQWGAAIPPPGGPGTMVNLLTGQTWPPSF